MWIIGKIFRQSLTKWHYDMKNKIVFKDGGRPCPDPLWFNKVDLLLVAAWFGLSASSALMYPSTQVDKCWYGDWIYIGLVAGGGSQQSLFYCKIYDSPTWRYSVSGWLSLSLSHLLTTSSDHPAQLQHQGHGCMLGCLSSGACKIRCI